MTLSGSSLLDVVPETLLALAKDERYVNQCNELIKEILPVPANPCPAGLSWLLYSILVVRRIQKTLGMEFCGLSVVNTQQMLPGVGNETETNSRAHNRLWKLMALSASLSMVIDYCLRLSCLQRDSSSVSANANSLDLLRGNARLQFHQRLRQAMLRRANGTGDQDAPAILSYTTQASPSDTTRTATSNAVTRFSCQLRQWRQKSIQIVQQTILDLASMTVSQQGPHTIMTSTQNNPQLAKWILRLCMAYFLLKGNFLGWKTMGILLQKDRDNIVSSRNNLYGFVPLLYLQQAFAMSVQTLTQLVTTWWIQHEQRKLSEPIQHGMFGMHPLKAPWEESSEIVCSICKLPRLHPAIPSRCGHIFCWKCLYQWTSTVRPECPLCRAHCRPQDIMALYNYCPL